LYVKIDQGIYKSELDMVNQFGREFKSFSSNNNLSTLFLSQKPRVVSEALTNLSSQLSSSICDDSKAVSDPFSKEELEAVLNSLKPKAGCGPDNISYLFLLHLPENGIANLLNLINKSWDEEVLPTAWKHSHVIP